MGPQRHLDHGRRRCASSTVAAQQAAAVATVAASFPVFIEAATLPTPDSPRPSTRHVQDCLLADAQMEATTLRGAVAGTAEYSRPHAVFAVVHQYELDLT